MSLIIHYSFGSFSYPENRSMQDGLNVAADTLERQALELQIASHNLVMPQVEKLLFALVQELDTWVADSHPLTTTKIQFLYTKTYLLGKL